MPDKSLAFQGSKRATLGLEWELQILDRHRLDLADRAIPVLEAFPGMAWIQPELIQSCVEIASKVCSDLHQLEAHLRSLLTELSRRCGELDLVLCGAGTHPFCRRLGLITPLPRYLRQKSVYGYMARNQITFANHVHLGVPDGETALTLMRELKPYLPILIALSANSPFWRGYETGFACYRQRILAAERSFGIPPTFSDWKQFCDFFALTRRAGIFENIHDIHWDLRPRPHLGTLEVRVMDAQSNLRDAIALAAFIQVLADFLLDTPPDARPPGLPRLLPWWLEKENYFQATLRGEDAGWVDDGGGVHSLRAMIESLLQILLARSNPRQRPYLSHLQRRLEEGVGWQRQLRMFSSTRRLAAVTAGLVAELC
ncbi:MAG: glutamate--cysteine ligase [Methylohalobius crimeensis]